MVYSQVVVDYFQVKHIILPKLRLNIIPNGSLFAGLNLVAYQFSGVEKRELSSHWNP